MKCPKCKSDMEDGLRGDYTATSLSDERWSPKEQWDRDGVVGRCFWSKERMKPVATYACRKCGYLESYIKR